MTDQFIVCDLCDDTFYNHFDRQIVAFIFSKCARLKVSTASIDRRNGSTFS